MHGMVITRSSIFSFKLNDLSNNCCETQVMSNLYTELVKQFKKISLNTHKIFGYDFSYHNDLT